MAFEYPTAAGVIRLTEDAGVWSVRFTGKRHGRWQSPDAAAEAVALCKTGLSQWDQLGEPVSKDIIDWRPLGPSI